MELERNLIFQCSNCGTEITVSKNDVDYTSTRYERNMGEEVLYEFMEFYECPSCENSIKIELTASEYPLGAYNHDFSTISGGFFLQEPNQTIIYRFDFDDFPYSSSLSDLIYSIQSNPNYIYDLTPRQFEEVIAELFISEGFDVQLTKKTRDGGKDLIVTKSFMGTPIVMIVECKRYDSQNKVSINVVRSLLGVHQDDKVNKAMVVTTSFFTKDAISFAERQGTMMELADFNVIMNWINKYK